MASRVRVTTLKTVLLHVFRQIKFRHRKPHLAGLSLTMKDKLDVAS
jgi:hypothetical protein